MEAMSCIVVADWKELHEAPQEAAGPYEVLFRPGRDLHTPPILQLEPFAEKQPAYYINKLDMAAQIRSDLTARVKRLEIEKADKAAEIENLRRQVSALTQERAGLRGSVAELQKEVAAARSLAARRPPE